MKKIFLLSLFFIFPMSFAAQTQGQATQPSQTTEAKPKKAIFKANKEQVLQAQKILKVTETGKLTKEDRAVLKTWQTQNNLKSTGTLNRATLEKMNIELTDKQKSIPVSVSSMKGDSEKSDSGEKKKRGPVFRATKEQVMQVQKILKVAESGKMTKEDREILKKWQTENGIKATGGVNKMTLEKMNIALTDKQKEM